MSEKNSGGSAFPDFKQTGITARDYFAAHAPAVPDTFPTKRWSADEVVDLGEGRKSVRSVPKSESQAARSVRWAIEYADAMLVERAK